MRPLQLVRPLLAIYRSEIEGYCADQGLTARFDRSNEDTTFYRNRLRQVLLPLLSEYNPAIREVLVRTAAVMAGDHEVLQAQTAAAWQAVAIAAGPGEVRFARDGWRQLPVALQRSTVREAIQRLRRSMRDVGWEHIERGVRMGCSGEAGQSATLSAGLALTVGYDALRIAGEGTPWALDVPQLADAVTLSDGVQLDLGGGWQVQARRVPQSALPPAFAANPDPWTAWLDAASVGPAPVLRPRVPGDRFLPQGLNGHSAKVNELMINLKTPRDARARWPVLVGNSGIGWVCGLRLSQLTIVRANSAEVWWIAFARHDERES